MPCTDKPGVSNRGTPGACFQKGLRVGYGAGINKGKEEGKETGKKIGKVLGEITGRKTGIKIGTQKLKYGKGLTIPELNSLSKDTLRDILSNRKRKGITTQQGGISSLSKVQLKNFVESDLRRLNHLKL